jgi:hypothetical protein
VWNICDSVKDLQRNIFKSKNNNWVVFEITYYINYFRFIYFFKRWKFFLFDTVRIWEFSPVWTDFDKFDNLSKRNVKLILKIFSPFKGLVEQKNVVFNSFLCNLGFFGIRGPLKLSFHSSFKLVHSCQKKPKLHTNSLSLVLKKSSNSFSLFSSPH